MTKKYSTTMTLIIVESPAKCKKIEEYLGPGYKCVATYGHLRELNTLKNVDITNNFTPTYTIIENAVKKKQIELIRREIKNANEVILACDADREGEKIAYCVAQIFKLDLIKTKRITFNEITETALKNAIENQRTIDIDMVNAQQARQILDLLVGFKISPLLWKLISMPKGKECALSAGRCQTPALKLIYDNEKEISNSLPQQVYKTIGYFTNANITFELNKQWESEQLLTVFLNGTQEFSHLYTCTHPKKIYKVAPEPFSTSTLQQTASNLFHYSPKETMKICQKLYEEGYITYMRTDSKKYSCGFIETVKTYIMRTYNDGNKYINKDIDLLSSNNNNNNLTKDNNLLQEAHEAIRPTNISLFELPENLDSKEKRMYKLIWETTLESCMSAASFYSITANISAFANTKFTYISEQIDFPGWKIVAKKYTTDNKEYQYLQTVKQNSVIAYKKICANVTINGLKHHYTEARLVQLLEEKGIGRPSTFASLVDKIQERGYVKKEDVKGKEYRCKDYELENGKIVELETKREYGNEKGKLVIQSLGMIVIEFLDKHFSSLFNYDYTKTMENCLDKIAKGEDIWYELCKQCNNEMDGLIENLKDKCKLEFKIDDDNTVIVGKYGPVIKCVENNNGKEEVKFKTLRKEIDIHKLENGEYKVEDIIDTSKNSVSHFILGQYNGYDVILKKGKFGLYISWGTNKKTIKEFGNRPMDNIRWEEVYPYLEEGSNIIREITKEISIRRGPKGDYMFYKTTRMKKPKFLDIKTFPKDTNTDYKICDINILKTWTKEKYGL